MVFVYKLINACDRAGQAISDRGEHDLAADKMFKCAWQKKFIYALKHFPLHFFIISKSIYSIKI